MAEPDLLSRLDGWRREAQACQRQMERLLLDDVPCDERRVLHEARRSAIGLQVGLLRVIDQKISAPSAPA